MSATAPIALGESWPENIKRLLLKDVASISTGYTFRSRLASEKGGTVSVLQIKDLSNKASLVEPLSSEAKKSLCKLRFDEGYERYLLNPNDVLFQSKGVVIGATVMPDGIGMAIAAAPIIVLSPDTSNVDPIYLAWFLNHTLGQRQIQQRLSGTSIQMVSRKALGTVEVVLPTLAVQDKIAAIASQHQQEQMLTEKIAQKRSQYINAVLGKMLTQKI